MRRRDNFYLRIVGLFMDCGRIIVMGVPLSFFPYSVQCVLTKCYVGLMNPTVIYRASMILILFLLRWLMERRCLLGLGRVLTSGSRSSGGRTYWITVRVLPALLHSRNTQGHLYCPVNKYWVSSESENAEFWAHEVLSCQVLMSNVLIVISSPNTLHAHLHST